MNKDETILRLLQENAPTRWVAEQVSATFAQGISMRVRDAVGDVGFASMQAVDATEGERRKREAYETTRPYTESEKLEILAKALEAVFVVLPAIQVAALQTLKEFLGTPVAVRFSSPEEPEPTGETYEFNLSSSVERKGTLARGFEEFRSEITSDDTQ